MSTNNYGALEKLSFKRIAYLDSLEIQVEYVQVNAPG